ncbi:MAG TPA: hypothetical protein VGC61_08650 [Pyrinomonadaceae bacterium]
MDKSTAELLLNGIALEGRIKAEAPKTASGRELPPANSAPVTAGVPRPTMPEYVQHDQGATEIGKLSAEAIVAEYEAAAKDIEAMGAELIKRVKQCETMTQDALAVIKEMKATAARYREEAKRVFLQIQECSLMTAEVRKTCTELKEKIAAPPTAPA